MLPLGDNVEKFGYGFIIWVIILANILVTFKIFNLPVWDYVSFLQRYSMQSSESLNVLSFLKKSLASMHMHSSYFHLWFNLWFLFVLGVSVEETIGLWAFLILYYGSGLAGWVLYYLLTQSDLPAIGSSGAVSGIMACYLILFPRAKILSFWLFFWVVKLIYLPAWLYIGVWVVSQFLSLTDKHPYTAYEAHVGGILFGLLFGFCFRYLSKEGRKLEYNRFNAS